MNINTNSEQLTQSQAESEDKTNNANQHSNEGSRFAVNPCNTTLSPTWEHRAIITFIHGLPEFTLLLNDTSLVLKTGCQLSRTQSNWAAIANTVEIWGRENLYSKSVVILKHMSVMSVSIFYFYKSKQDIW